MTVLDKARELSNELRGSQELYDFLQKRELLFIDEVLSDSYLYYKELYNYICSKPNPTFEERSRLSKLYWDLCLNPVARDVFEAEKALVIMLREVYGEIDEALSGFKI